MSSARHVYSSSVKYEQSMSVPSRLLSPRHRTCISTPFSSGFPIHDFCTLTSGMERHNMAGEAWGLKFAL